MNSIGHRGVTVVTIVTLVFMPVFRNHHWVWKLTGRRSHTVTVMCAAHEPCPKRSTTVERVYRKPSRDELKKARTEGAGAPKAPDARATARPASPARRR